MLLSLCSLHVTGTVQVTCKKIFTRYYLVKSITKKIDLAASTVFSFIRNLKYSSETKCKGFGRKLPNNIGPKINWKKIYSFCVELKALILVRTELRLTVLKASNISTAYSLVTSNGKKNLNN